MWKSALFACLAFLASLLPLSLAHADDGDDGDDVAAEEPAEVFPTTVTASLNVSMLRRRFEYNDDIYGLLRDYELEGAAVLGFSVEAYPGARLDRGALQNLGGRLRYSQAIAIETTRADGTVFPTRALAYDIDLRGRLHIMERSELGGYIGFGRQIFEIEAARAEPGLDNQPGVPSVDYRALRLGMFTLMRPWKELRMQLELAYLAVTSTGDIESDAWFPNAISDGMELDIAIGYEFRHGVFVDGAMEFRHYWYDMRSEPGDANIAGGASDNYLAFTLRMGWTY